MIDKVQKIREEVEKLMYGFNLEADIASCEDAETEKLADIKYQLCKKILDYIDKVQKEPISERKCVFTKDSYTDEERQVLCEDCKEKCEYSKKEEPVSADLGKYINELSKQFPEVSFAKLSRIAVRVAKWQTEQIKEALLSEVLPCFMHGGEADEVVAKLDEVLNQKK